MRGRDRLHELNDGRRALRLGFNAVRHLVLRLLDVAADRQCAIDSLPVPVVQFHLVPGASREWAAHGAAFGRVSSKKATIYGYKLHLLVTLGGVILDFELAPANAPEAQVGYELLVELHAQGTIPYRAYRLTETTTPERFPVFIRNADDHAGPRTGLLHNQDELDTAIVGLIVRRHPLERLIVVEYHDTADDTGMYRKYGAFIVGERVIARHLNFRQGWIVKKAHLETPEINAEEMAYVKSNPHQEEIARICKLGGIQYGRIDYSIRDGEMITWEINTNPVVVKVRGTQSETSMARQLVFVPALTDAFEAIDDRVHHGQTVSLAAIPAAVREAARRRPARAGGGALRLARTGKPIMEAAMTAQGTKRTIAAARSAEAALPPRRRAMQQATHPAARPASDPGARRPATRTWGPKGESVFQRAAPSR